MWNEHHICFNWFAFFFLCQHSMNFRSHLHILFRPASTNYDIKLAIYLRLCFSFWISGTIFWVTCHKSWRHIAIHPFAVCFDCCCNWSLFGSKTTHSFFHIYTKMFVMPKSSLRPVTFINYIKQKSNDSIKMVTHTKQPTSHHHKPRWSNGSHWNKCDPHHTHTQNESSHQYTFLPTVTCFAN